MGRFTVRLEKAYYWAGSALAYPRDLLLTPESWSASDRGGCKQASIRATGSAESLAYLTTWLGDRVEIFSEEGECVWWGDLWDIEITLGAIQISITLDQVSNRIAVTYAQTLPDGTQESRTTDWVEDADSIAHYGTRELLYGQSDGDLVSAPVRRDQLLRKLSLPSPTFSTSGDIATNSAMLTAQGTWYKADSIYFTNPLGLIEAMDENGSQHLGMSLTSTQIHFGQDSQPAGGYATEASEMTIEGGATFDGLQVKDDIYIEGSVAVGDEGERNNGTTSIDKMDHPYQIGSGKDFVKELVGPSITVSVGDLPSVDGIAQAFKSGAVPWTLTKVSLNVRAIGTPTDSLRVALCADNAGNPGAFLSAVDTPGSAIFTEMTWTEIDMPHYTFAPNTYYWLMVQRNTSMHALAHGYEIGVDEDLNFRTNDGNPGVGVKVMKSSAPGSWVARDPDCDLCFRLIAEISSTEQMRAVIEAVDSFQQPIILLDSGVAVLQHEDSKRTCLDVFNSLLDLGLGGESYVVWLARDRSVIVDVAPPASSEDYLLGLDGRLRYPNGSNALPGKLIYGQTVTLDSLILFDTLGQRAKSGRGIYIRESRYNAEQDRLTLLGEGALDPWSALNIRRA